MNLSIIYQNNIIIYLISIQLLFYKSYGYQYLNKINVFYNSTFYNICVKWISKKIINDIIKISLYDINSRFYCKQTTFAYSWIFSKEIINWDRFEAMYLKMELNRYRILVSFFYLSLYLLLFLNLFFSFA